MTIDKSVHSGLRKLALLLMSSAIVCPASAFAQDAANEPVAGGAVDASDIVVTARRVAESAQDVPVAVTALSGEALATRGIANAQALNGQVPSLTVGAYGGQGRDVSTFTLRGQGQVYGASPSVVTYVNEVPLIAGTIRSIQGPGSMFFDLENVQVVNGPQGTLFGRNTTGGAVLLTPAEPRDELGGYILGGIGNYKNRLIEAVVNMPVTPTLAVRLAAHRQKRNGFTRDLVTGTDYDNKDEEFVRLSVLWKPVDRLENLLVGYYSNSRSNGTGNVPVFLDPSYTASLAALSATYAGPARQIVADYANTIAQRGPRAVALNGLAMSNNRIVGWGVTDRLTYELTDNLTIRNIASVSHLRARLAFDSDGTPLPINNAPLKLTQEYPDSYKQFTEELQLQGSAAERKIQYQVGLYFEEVKTDRPNIYRVYRTATQEKINQIEAKKRSLGLYVQSTIDLGLLTPALDGLNVTGGIRYTKDNNRVAGSTWYARDPYSPVEACGNGINPAPVTPADCRISILYKRSEVTWTLGADYHFAPNLMGYAKVSRGYKAGGANPQAVNLATSTYAPETVISYEAGLKSDFPLGGARGRFNITGYYNDYSNIQKASADFNLATGALGAATYNAAGAVIKGIETEFGLRAGPFDLTANYSHATGHYKDFILQAIIPQTDCTRTGTAVGVRDLSCIPIEGLARNQFSVTGNFTQATSAGTIRLTANYAYIGPRYVAPTALPEAEPGSRIAGYGLINLSAGIEGIAGSQVDLRLFATNVTDKTYRIGNSNVYSFYKPYGIGYASSLYGEPRMYGAEVKVNF